jgi:hypothetical protein
MSKAHNKKRNTALLYEFLVRSISTALVDGDKKTSTVGLKILRRHFKPGTELYKEFRLFNALAKTTVTSDNVSTNIINETRIAASGINIEALDGEKSRLIHNINHLINNENFYDQPIPQYKMYATIQTLFNEWRKPRGTSDIAVMAKYEQSLRDWLLESKDSGEQTILDETPGTSRLLMKVMMKKLNEKYNNALNSEQREIIRSYAFSAAKEDQATIKRKLHEIKNSLLESIDSYSQRRNDDKFVVEKMNNVKEQILEESLDNVDDATVSRFMLYSALRHELNDTGEEK